MPEILLPAEFRLELDLTSKEAIWGKQSQARPCASSDFLMRHPGAPYTTVLTVNEGAAIPMLDFHCRRMCKALEQLYPSVALIDPSRLRDSLMYLFSQISLFRGSGRGEVQLTPILLAENQKLYLAVHACNFPDPSSNIVAIDAECRGKPRINPQVKDTAWATQRKPLENGRKDGASETILVDVDNDGYHSLLEGLVSNVFVVLQNLEVWTAPSHLVLPGSLRECVLVACEELGVKVVHRPIRLADFNEFEAAFVTNARRYLHPIRCLHIADPEISSECPQQINLRNGAAATELVDKLRSVVCRILTQNATRIPPSTSNVQHAD